MHSKTYAEVRRAAFARVLNSSDLALNAAITETARHQNSVQGLEHINPITLDILSIDVVDFNAGTCLQPSVPQSFVE